MLRVAVLLLGFERARAAWHALIALGVLLLAGGLFITFDSFDGVTYLTINGVAVLLIVAGALQLFGITADPYFLVQRLIRGIAFVVVGFLVVDLGYVWPYANSILIGLLALSDGAIRAVGAYLTRFRGWRGAALLSLAEFCFGLAILVSWPIAGERAIPTVVGVALVTCGVSALSLGYAIVHTSAFTPAEHFKERLWARLFGKRVERRPSTLPVEAAAATLPRSRSTRPEQEPPPVQRGAPHGPLTVYIWMPGAAAAQTPRAAQLLSRYVAAIDSRGKVSVGHAALEMRPDVYVSHYRAEELEVSPGEFRSALRSTADQDVPGFFMPSYDYEVSTWVPATRSITFHRLNAEHLREVWSDYARDGSYNLTNRNCSVAVTVALDAALEGVLSGMSLARGALTLALHPEIWLAGAIRARAENIAWTPGLVGDYAYLLRLIVERARRAETLARGPVSIPNRGP